jgi:hypothetical protein
MTLHMDDIKPIACACGRIATHIDKMDMGLFANCDDGNCKARASAAIELASRRHPARLKVFDTVRAPVMSLIGDRAPTDRVLAVVHGMLDMTGSLISGIFRATNHPDWNKTIDAWKLRALNDLGEAMRDLGKKSTQTELPT